MKKTAVVAAMCVACLAGSARAQTIDSTRCDSIVAASRRDSVKAGLFLLVKTLDIETTPEYQQSVATAIATAFVPPRPFRLTVFSGPAQMRTFRRMGADTLTELRAPTVTGVYHFYGKRTAATQIVQIFRASLIPGLDSSAVEAIRAASMVVDLFQMPAGVDSMLFEARFTSDPMPNAVKIVEASFPRMPVTDAVPRADNPPPKPMAFSIETDTTRRFDVTLRFVVDRSGLPALETVEVVRGNSTGYLRSAFDALPKQRFVPARVNGCAVAQVVEYPFAFVPPDGVSRRH